MRRATAVIVGAGNRGKDAYGFYAAHNPDKLKIVAVAEPNEEKRLSITKIHGIPEELCFASWEELASKDKIADAAIISTPDHLHVKPAIAFMEKGYDLLLEKPMATNLEDAIKIAVLAQKLNRKVMVAHVLRYTSFFSKLKELIQSEIIGKIMSIEHKENIGYYHMAHSYVRGNWRREDETAPIILTKSCHDMDILYWLVGKKSRAIASFGHLSHFRKENKPAGATERCTDGCAVERECPYSAIKIYLGKNTGWPVSVITQDLSYEGRLKALQEGPYGRCVYSCDNDVLDHQVVSIEFEDEITASFTLTAFTEEITRKINIFGTKGEIIGHFEKNEIEVAVFGKEKFKIRVFPPEEGGHNGGDFQMMDAFVRLLTEPDYQGTFTSPMDSLESHFMAFAAERSRLSRTVVNMEEFRKEFLG
ncbi:MAG: hypothetical protein PWQ27_993 [Kosmotoga sp.]|nr:hypothetical protein [Kosmotoga sp.]